MELILKALSVQSAILEALRLSQRGALTMTKTFVPFELPPRRQNSSEERRGHAHTKPKRLKTLQNKQARCMKP